MESESGIRSLARGTGTDRGAGQTENDPLDASARPVRVAPLLQPAHHVLSRRADCCPAVQVSKRLDLAAAQAQLTY